MKKFCSGLLHHLDKVALALIFLLSLGSLTLCGIMYQKMEAYHALYLDSLSCQDQGTMELEPSQVPLSSGDLSAGDTVTFRICADKAEDLYGYQFNFCYDEDKMEYKNLKSSVDEITTIFQKPFEGYLMVGATKIGEAGGFNGENVPVCELTMTIKQDGPVPDITLEKVSVVDSQLNYSEGVTGWSYEVLM